VGAGALPQRRQRETDAPRPSIFHTRFSFTKWRAICQTPQDKQPVERVGRTGCMLTAPLSISIQTDHLKPFVHSFTRQSVKGELIGHKLIRAAARTPQISRRLFLALSPGRCFCSFIGFYVDTHSLLSSVCGCNE